MSRVASVLISVITPTYNHERFIGTCLESVLRQTHTNWEHIIIDDGSSDRTQSIIASFQDPRIRYQRQENQGPFQLANTYNRALRTATGELIAILEGDDFWPANKLATLVSAFQDNAVVLAYGRRVDVDARGRKQRKKTDTARRLEKIADSVLCNDPVGSATRYMLREEGRSLVGPCTVIIRKTALDGIGGFQYVPGLPLIDYPTFLELSLTGKFFYSHQTSGYLRRHQNSITANHPRLIHEAVSRFTRGFVERHSDQLGLSPSDWQVIEHSWREAEDRMHFSEGRLLLLQRQWTEARGHFRMASRSNRTKVRVAALTGILLSLAHLNLEPIMKIGGRSDMRSDSNSQPQREPA